MLQNKSSQPLLRPAKPDDALSVFLSRFSFTAWRPGTISLDEPVRISGQGGLVHFYVLISGRCRLTLEPSSDSTTMESGDCIILLNGSAHTLNEVDSEASTAQFGDSSNSLPAFCSPAQKPSSSANVLFGRFAIHPSELSQLTQCLPGKIHIPSDSGNEQTAMSPVLETIYSECNSPTDGSDAVVKQALQLLFLETLRYFIITDAKNSGCLLDDIGGQSFITLDSQFGPLIRLLHAEPEKNWTVEKMARQAKMSRSTFSDRFRKFVGHPPAEYLTIIRMRKSCDLLQSTELPIKRIAKLVGYESESAFSNAFKRRVGKPPISYRRLLS